LHNKYSKILHNTKIFIHLHRNNRENRQITAGEILRLNKNKPKITKQELSDKLGLNI